MPLRSGTSRKIVSKNIREFHKGPTFKRTARKFGKARANAQAVAVALGKKRQSRRKRRK